MEATAPGAAVYTPATLRIYDWLVLGVSNRWIWRCPTPRLLDFYKANVTDNHLDVGVGTGYFLDRCGFSSPRPRLMLMDANVHCLERAAKRLARYQPEVTRANILEPLSSTYAPFDSIGLNYVLHCLRGFPSEKAAAIDHLLPLLSTDGSLFGATLLGELPEPSRSQPSAGSRKAARWLTSFYNARGIFQNRHDTAETLETELSGRFASLQFEIVGHAALFVGREPRKPGHPATQKHAPTNGPQPAN